MSSNYCLSALGVQSLGSDDLECLVLQFLDGIIVLCGHKPGTMLI